MEGDDKWGMLAWLELGDGVVMIGRTESEVHQISSPREIGGKFTCMINVHIEDIKGTQHVHLPFGQRLLLFRDCHPAHQAGRDLW